MSACRTQTLAPMSCCRALRVAGAATRAAMPVKVNSPQPALPAISFTARRWRKLRTETSCRRSASIKCARMLCCTFFEFTTPLATAKIPFATPYAAETWLTGELSIGHLLMLVLDKNVMTRFLFECFGFRYSNTGKAPWNGMAGFEVDFLNCNARDLRRACRPTDRRRDVGTTHSEYAPRRPVRDRQ